ncbi:MAG: hypothetical protein EYC70_07255 [Planctomycetota bacterium]|nr:MAG: hypothetical protein EYC70_07255 [Planctomycetota bacterium]
MTRPSVLAVRLPNPVGDVVAATPLLRALRQAQAAEAIILAGSSGAAELLAGLDSYDRFEVLPAGRGVAAEARLLRRSRAEAVLLLPNSWSSALAARLAGIGRRIGRRAAGRGPLLSETLPPVGAPRAMSALYFELGAPLGVSGAVPGPELAITPGEEALAANRLAGSPTSAPLLAVAPGATFGASKIYPVPLLAEVLHALHARLGLRPLLLGSPAEAPLLRDLAQRLGAAAISTHAAPAGLGEMKALLRRCTALLCMDNGARAMAAALRVPAAVLYGPTDPRWSGPGSGGAVHLRRADLPCSPCHLKHCPIGHACLRGVPPARVVEALQGLLGAAGAPA